MRNGTCTSAPAQRCGLLVSPISIAQIHGGTMLAARQSDVFMQRWWMPSARCHLKPAFKVAKLVRATSSEVCPLELVL